MLLAAFSALPIRVQSQITAILRVELTAHGVPATYCTQQECQTLLTTLDPVLTWSRTDSSLVLPRPEWERLLQSAHQSMAYVSVAAEVRRPQEA